MTTLCGRKRKHKNVPEWRDVLSSFLREKGLRATQQREKIAEIALSKKHHFDIQNLIREVQERYHEISPATVYRGVKTLCEAGILHETLQTDSGVTLYEAFAEDHHDHIVCLDCGEIFEFHDEGIERAQDTACSRLGFSPQRHRHVIYAKCEHLKKK